MTAVRVVLVEDEPGYARLVSEILSEAGEHKVTWVPTLTEALPLLVPELTDVVLIDLGLPDAEGMEAVVQVRTSAPSLPIVVLSGQGNLETALESMREGAQEYLVKGQAEHQLLPRAVRYAVERKRMQDFEQLLVGVVGHDLRNPLQTIVFAAQPLLNDSALSSEHHARLQRISSAASRANALVHDLMDLTRIRVLGKALSLERRDTDVAAIVRQVVDDACLTAGPGRVAYDGSGPLMARVDPGRFGQVVTNLIGNAVDHGDVKAPAVVRLTQAGGDLVLSVHNHGPHIPAEYHGQVFEPLRSAAGGAERRGSGLGLGLYIVREIVGAHGGVIEVASTAADGTTFRVTLPCAE